MAVYRFVGERISTVVGVVGVALALVFTFVLAVVLVLAGPAAASASTDSAGASDGSSAPADLTLSTWSVPVEPGPVQHTNGAAARYYEQHPDAAPVGVNNFSCRPSSERPRPVVLLHGTDSSVYTDFARLGPALAASGFCVFGLDYGTGPHPDDGNGWGDGAVSAGQLAEFVDRVLADTGAAEVDVIGMSQGANVARWWINHLDGAEQTHKWIGLASPTRGGTFYGLATLAHSLGVPDSALAQFLQPGLLQQRSVDPWIAELNADGETAPGVEYATVSTRFDEMIQPFDTMAIHGAGGVIHNHVLQDWCPSDRSGHMLLPYSPTVIDLVIAELDGSTPDPRCTDVPLGHGMLEIVIDSNS